MDYETMEFKAISDEELLNLRRTLIAEAEELMRQISDYTRGGRKARKDDIKGELSLIHI